MLYGNLPTPQNLPISGACSSRPSNTESQSYGQCSEPEPISRIGHIIIFSHLSAKKTQKYCMNRWMRLGRARQNLPLPVDRKMLIFQIQFDKRLSCVQTIATMQWPWIQSRVSWRLHITRLKATVTEFTFTIRPDHEINTFFNWQPIGAFLMN